MTIAGPRQPMAGGEIGAQEHPGVVPTPAAEEARLSRDARRSGGDRRIGLRLGEAGAAADRLDRDGFDDKVLALVHEAEAAPVRGLEGAPQIDGPTVTGGAPGHLVGGNLESGIRSRVADMGPHMHLDVGARHALPAQLLDAGLARACRPVRASAACDGLERQLERARARGAHVGEAHAVGREQAGQRMDEHAS